MDLLVADLKSTLLSGAFQWYAFLSDLLPRVLVKAFAMVHMAAGQHAQRFGINLYRADGAFHSEALLLLLLDGFPLEEAGEKVVVVTDQLCPVVLEDSNKALEVVPECSHLQDHQQFKHVFGSNEKLIEIAHQLLEGGPEVGQFPERQRVSQVAKCKGIVDMFWSKFFQLRKFTF